MPNPALVLRGGNSGPTFADSTPGYVLTVQADGKSVKPAPGSAGVIDASEVNNDSAAPGASVADALTALTVNPSTPEELDNGNFTGGKSLDSTLTPAQFFTLTGNTTLTILGLIANRSQWLQLRAIQGGIGSFTLSIVGAKTPGGSGLSLSTAVGAEDVVSVYWSGTALYAQVAGLAFA